MRGRVSPERLEEHRKRLDYGRKLPIDLLEGIQSGQPVLKSSFMRILTVSARSGGLSGLVRASRTSWRRRNLLDQPLERLALWDRDVVAYWRGLLDSFFARRARVSG